MKNWLEQYNENYYGQSNQAKELAECLKQTYSGANYLPWATMERLIYQQDPEATFEIITHFAGQYAATQKIDILTKQQSDEKISETLSQAIVNMVHVRLTFLGKTFDEVYPIQDNVYKAPKVIDANLVNKALQRAKAKIAARASGLGLTLYETGDLQFEDDKDLTADSPPKPLKEPKLLTKTKQEFAALETFNEVSQAATEINENQALQEGLAKVNAAVLKKYGFILEANAADLQTKLEKIENIPVFMRTLKKLSGLEIEE